MWIDRKKLIPMSQDELAEIWDEHMLWLTGNGGKRAEIVNRDLSGLNLSDSCWAHALFKNVSLEKADLSWTDFSTATMIGVSFKGAKTNNMILN